MKTLQYSKKAYGQIMLLFLINQLECDIYWLNWILCSNNKIRDIIGIFNKLIFVSIILIYYFRKFKKETNLIICK